MGMHNVLLPSCGQRRTDHLSLYIDRAAIGGHTPEWATAMCTKPLADALPVVHVIASELCCLLTNLEILQANAATLLVHQLGDLSVVVAMGVAPDVEDGFVGQPPCPEPRTAPGSREALREGG